MRTSIQLRVRVRASGGRVTKIPSKEFGASTQPHALPTRLAGWKGLATDRYGRILEERPRSVRSCCQSVTSSDSVSRDSDRGVRSHSECPLRMVHRARAMGNPQAGYASEDGTTDPPMPGSGPGRWRIGERGWSGDEPRDAERLACHVGGDGQPLRFYCPRVWKRPAQIRWSNSPFFAPAMKAASSAGVHLRSSSVRCLYSVEAPALTSGRSQSRVVLGGHFARMSGRMSTWSSQTPGQGRLPRPATG